MHKMWNSSKFLKNTWKNLAHGPQFGLMGLSNFQIQRLGWAWAKMIRPRPVVGQTPKMALLKCAIIYSRRMFESWNLVFPLLCFQILPICLQKYYLSWDQIIPILQWNQFYVKLRKKFQHFLIFICQIIFSSPALSRSDIIFFVKLSHVIRRSSSS